MQKSWIHYTKELFVTQMNHWILVVAALTVLSIFSADNLYVGFLLLMGVVPAFYYLLRSKIKYFSIFLLLHCLPFCVLIFCISNITLFLLTTAILLFHFVYSIKARVKPGNAENPFIGSTAGVCCIAICAFLHNYYAQIDITTYYVVALFAFLIVFFLYYFMDHYVWFINVQKNSVDNVSEQSLWIGGLKQLLTFIIITCIVMLLICNVEWLSFLLSKIGLVFVYILRFILSFIKLKPDTESSDHGTDMFYPEEHEEIQLAGGETSIIWVVLEYIAIAFFIVFLIWGLFHALSELFAFLRNGFYRNKRKKTEESFDGIDLREDCEIIHRKRYSKKFFVAKNNRDLARRIYKKFIIKHRHILIGNLKKEYLKPLTAGECCEKLETPDVQQLYEKVRYSEEEISSADVKALKEKTKL